MSIFKEIETLQNNSGKTLGIFKKKTESLSRLKIDFFEKMQKFESEENIEKASNYFSYFKRAAILSFEIYEKTLKELQNYETISITSLTEEEIEALKIFDPEQKFIALEVNGINYINLLKQTTYQLSKENNSPLLELKQILAYQKDLLNKIENPQSEQNLHYNPLFKELEFQKEMHEYLKKEQMLSKNIISIIDNLNKQTITFSQNIQKQIKETNAILSNIANQMRNHPFETITKPIEILGEFLERNASIFAAVTLGLALTSVLATFAGSTVIVGICHSTILVMAEYGEGAQAFPALKRGFLKAKEKMQLSMQNALQSLNSLQTN